MISCQTIIEAMEKIAPHNLAEEWDNPGLLIGDPAQKINKLIVCLDVNNNVINTALKEKCDMIISHHPFIFHPLKKIRTDLPQGKSIQTLLANNIAVFAAHTNLDSALGGINDYLCHLWGLHNTIPLNTASTEELIKLIVFVPVDYAEKVRLAIGKAGAGFVGKYSNCSFESNGTGHFLPLPGTNPFIGEIGKTASVNETKIETIFPAKIQSKVIKAMLKAHPYEEAAYELHSLKPTNIFTGLGRIGELSTAIDLEDFTAMIKNTLPVKNIRLVKSNNKKIKKAALCSGTGAEFINRAKFMGADIYITGDVKYHEAQKAQELNMNLIDAGHFGTEFPIVKYLAKKLETIATKNKWQIKVLHDKASVDPFTVI
ncbi:Nif3-like dinuclear metal center hexameric protein [Pectinatus sottacetonis]|uniref:Nif3-like dinuclear metal center hexameric protein n=1 Tax=Pectinatus sottacetonis TaxID=1002795 RepID=UPI0018C63354|nr:Nif3-like dinuclear metal center hexameric protein [Pectinatus sottacetonis]